jgi:hypothetical protein
VTTIKQTSFDSDFFGKVKDDSLSLEKLSSDLADIAKYIKTKADLVAACALPDNIICNISGNIIIDSNLTIPKNITLKFSNQAKLTINSGVTLTVNGYIDAGLWQIFDPIGTVTGTIKNQRLHAIWFGVTPDDGTKKDQTSAIAKFLNVANAMKTEAYFIKGYYYANEIDLSVFNGKGGIMIAGEGYNAEYPLVYFYCLDKTKILNTVGAFLFLSDTGSSTPAGATNREISIKNIVIHDNNNGANYGYYANGVTFANVENILVYGFKTGIALGRQWNSKYVNINIYHFSEYGLRVGPSPVVNATTLHKIHCSSDLQAIANIFCDQNRSAIFYELTTEGSALTHVKFRSGNESFIVYGWHVEGGKNLFDITDLTSRLGSIEIYGANIFLGADSSLADSRLFLFTNCSSIGGISTLTIRGSLRLDASTHADYLSLDRIYSSDIMLNFGVPTPAVDFKNVGALLSSNSSTIVTSNITPVGYLNTDYHLKRGLAGNFESHIFKSAASILNTATTILKLKEPRGTKRLYLDIEVGNTYDSGAFAGTVDFATYKVCISANGTITSVLINSNGTYAKTMTFTWIDATQELQVSTTSNVGYYDFVIRGHKSRI